MKEKRVFLLRRKGNSCQGFIRVYQSHPELLRGVVADVAFTLKVVDLLMVMN